MFRLFGCGGEKSTAVVDVAANESRKSPRSRKSVPDIPAANIKKDEKTSWVCRLFGRLMTKIKKESVANSDDKTTEPKKKAKKAPWWRKKRNRVAPAPEEPKKNPKEQPPPTPQQDKVVKLEGEKEENTLPVEEKVVEFEGEKEAKTLPVEEKVVEFEGEKEAKTLPVEEKVVKFEGEKEAKTLPVEEKVVKFEGEKEEKTLPVEKKVVKFAGEKEEKTLPVKKKVVKFQVEDEEKTLPVEEDKVPQAVPQNEPENVDSVRETLRYQQVKHLGFPNPAQICYMNSCLQSLLTLEDFVESIRSQKHIWSSIPGSEIMRSFMDIRELHCSRDFVLKFYLLRIFKRAVSDWSPVFLDYQQKDAHEFLTSVLNQMRSLTPQLQMIASSRDLTYSCPVEDHLMFKMKNTRTCQSCGAGSTTEEEFTNLSLDLVPGGGTVEDLLQNYLKETEMEYMCECGATKSSLRSSFETMPRVLVLQLKRFRVTPSYEVIKANDPIVLVRDLVVSSSEGGSCYSLVSTINHLGTVAGSGHYVCDGVDPEVPNDDSNDRWITYNDTKVKVTTGESVCEKRKEVAYILFYKKHD